MVNTKSVLKDIYSAPQVMIMKAASNNLANSVGLDDYTDVDVSSWE